MADAECRHDRERSRIDELLEERERKVEAETLSFIRWFENKPESFIDYLTEDEVMDFAYELLRLEQFAQLDKTMQDCFDGLRERKAKELAELEIPDVETVI